VYDPNGRWQQRLVRWLAKRAKVQQGQMLPLWIWWLYNVIDPVQAYRNERTQREQLYREREHVCPFCYRSVHGREAYGHVECELVNR
jgi:hypothetical protein